MGKTPKDKSSAGNKALAVFKNPQAGFILIVVSLVSCVAGYLFATFMGNGVDEAADSQMIETREGGYAFINPLWECDEFRPSRHSSMLKLEKDLKAFIDSTMKEKNAAHVSVYFRVLNSGPWLGIHEHENYSPASLLKVPVMMAVLKKAESEPGLLQARVPFEAVAVTEFTQNIKEGDFLEVGNSYSVEELIERMIINSDNEAKQLLFALLGDAWMEKTMTDIGIDVSGPNVLGDFVSVKTYSSFFRLLYNATYLNREMSEKALALLGRVGFAEGIRKPLPKHMKVAHKFGEREFGPSLKQLHDCGIVYRGNSPYLLCVMTKGANYDKLVRVIAKISGIVYQNMNSPA